MKGRLWWERGGGGRLDDAGPFGRRGIAEVVVAV